MTICAQCNGKLATQGIEAIQDLSGNTETLQGATGAVPGAIPCSQCGGRGYY